METKLGKKKEKDNVGGGPQKPWTLLEGKIAPKYALAAWPNRP
jgi:hypothetical protein